MVTTKIIEPVLDPSNKRFVVFPIDKKYQDLWNLYEKHESTFWRAREIDYSADVDEWESLDKNTKHFIEMILAFFAASDGIVMENIGCNFADEVQIFEARMFYGVQFAMENVHSLTYSLLIDTLVKDKIKKDKLFNAISNFECIKAKADWALKWMDNTKNDFATRLIAFAIVEGVFFSGAFCSIFWLKDQKKMMNSLGSSNELIARDESLHVEFAVALFHHLKYKVPAETVYDIMKEAVKLEKNFICDSIPCDMIGMNKTDMSEYIEFVADRLLTQLKYPKMYNTLNPFDFMEKIGLEGKTNFFEKRVTEYEKNNESGGNLNFDIDSDDW